MGIATLLAAAGCSKSVEPVPDKNTNWLMSCESDAECDDGTSCLCGICTTPCGSADDCASGDVDATCRVVTDDALADQCEEHAGEGVVAVCVASCDDDSSCQDAVEPGASCRDDICLRPSNAFVRVQGDASVDGSVDLVGGDPDAGLDAGLDMMVDATVDVLDAAVDARVPLIEGCEGACPSGTQCLGERCVDVLASEQAMPWSLAADGSYLYWANLGSSDSLGNYRGDGVVMRQPLAGGASEVVAQDRDRPQSLATDGDHVFWTEYAPGADRGRIFFAAADGSAPAELFADMEAKGNLALDDTHVYWITPRGSFDGGIWRAPKDGSGVPEGLLDTGISYEGQLAVDATYVYWLSEYTVFRALKTDGTGAEQISVAGMTADLVSDGDALYWSTADGDSVGVESLPLDSEDGYRLLANEVGLNVAGITVDADYVYWTYMDDGDTLGTLAYTEKQPGTTQPLLASPLLQWPQVLAAGDSLYLTSWGQSPQGGALYRLPKP